MTHQLHGRLRSRDLGEVADAVDAFGEDNGLILCRIDHSLLPKKACDWVSKRFPFFTIPEGFYALVLRGGKDADFSYGCATWPAGFHWDVPWARVRYTSYLVVKSKFPASSKLCNDIGSDCPWLSFLVESILAQDAY